MSAKDVFHEVVKKALQKDGWQITHDPLSISVGGVNLCKLDNLFSGGP